jgi:hypothetical protein
MLGLRGSRTLVQVVPNIIFHQQQFKETVELVHSFPRRHVHLVGDDSEAQPVESLHLGQVALLITGNKAAATVPNLFFIYKQRRGNF